MLDRIIVNLFYLIPLKVSKFKKQYPDAEVLIADGTKARKEKSNAQVQLELRWVTARRDMLVLTTQGLYCGDWTIPLSNIQEATLLHIPGGSVLKVSTQDDWHYQFGMQRNPAWEKQDVLPLQVQETVLKYSKLSLLFRLLIMGWLVYLFGQDYLRYDFSISSILYVILFMGIGYTLLKYLRFSKGH